MPCLNDIINYQYNTFREEREEIFKWVIEEELELIFGVFADSHLHNRNIYSDIHSELNKNFQGKLSVIIRHYIRVPLIYSDNNIVKICMNELDLIIKYHANLPRLIF
jgi:hypothetical protein